MPDGFAWQARVLLSALVLLMLDAPLLAKKHNRDDLDRLERDRRQTIRLLESRIRRLQDSHQLERDRRLARRHRESLHSRIRRLEDDRHQLERDAGSIQRDFNDLRDTQKKLTSQIRGKQREVGRALVQLKAVAKPQPRTSPEAAALKEALREAAEARVWHHQVQDRLLLSLWETQAYREHREAVAVGERRLEALGSNPPTTPEAHRGTRTALANARLDLSQYQEAWLREHVPYLAAAAKLEEASRKVRMAHAELERSRREDPVLLAARAFFVAAQKSLAHLRQLYSRSRGLLSTTKSQMKGMSKSYDRKAYALRLLRSQANTVDQGLQGWQGWQGKRGRFRR